MGATIVIVGITAFAVIMGVNSGVSFERYKYGRGLLFLLITLLVTTILAVGTHEYIKKQTLLYIDPVKEEVFVVLKKVPDEKGAFLVLLDTKNNNERVAHLAVYPPEGYAETVLPDGRVVLAVTNKQIVVGDPKNADFVPPKKID